jgi:phosphoglucosamine mutase
VLAELEQRGWQVGGESSGHILCLNLTTTGDGVVAALQVVAAMAEFGSTLHNLKQKMAKLPQRMINVRCAPVVMGVLEVTQAVKSIEGRLAGRGRVLLRPSGTEPVVRVMVEGENLEEVTALAEELAAVVAGAGAAAMAS